MNKFLIKLLLIFTCSLGISFTVLALNNGQELSVDFGLVKAFEPVVKSQSCLLPTLNSQINGLLIEANSGLLNSQNFSKIPPERMSLVIGEKVFTVSSVPVEALWPKTIPTGPLVGAINFELRPIDYPGNYEGIIILKFWKVNPSNTALKIWLDPIKLVVKVQIEPWIRLQTDQNTLLKLEPVLNQTAKNLRNSEPLIINVASNTYWSLYVKLQSTTFGGPIFDLPYLITTKSNSNSYQGIQQLQITLYDGKKMIASGAPTVKDQQYWCEIPLVIELKDFVKYPAGLYNFGILFSSAISD